MLKLNLSGSVKNLEELKESSGKYKTLSLSPKQSAGGSYTNTQNNNSFSIHSIEKTSNNSPASLKRVKMDYSLPKVLMTDIKDSDREINIPKSSSNTRKSDSAAYTFVFNAFYNRLIEAQNSIKTNDPLALVGCFIKIFDHLALNADMKFKNINDIIKVYCDPKATVKSYKEEIAGLIEQNAKLKYELDMAKSQLGKKEMLALSYIDKLKEQELHITKLKSKLQSHKELKDENKQLIDYIKDLKSELEFLREKEGKLMKVIYSIHKKGIAIDDLLTGDGENTNSDRTSSTYYFPDKVHMNERKENVPFLDLGAVPGYETLRKLDAQEAVGNKDSTIYFNEIVVDEPKGVKKKSVSKNKKTKPNKSHSDYNSEFLQNYDEYSESWRNEVKQINSFKEFLKKKK
jgi:hypothetical protein